MGLISSKFVAPAFTSATSMIHSSAVWPSTTAIPFNDDLYVLRQSTVPSVCSK